MKKLRNLILIFSVMVFTVETQVYPLNNSIRTFEGIGKLEIIVYKVKVTYEVGTKEDDKELVRLNGSLAWGRFQVVNCPDSPMNIEYWVLDNPLRNPSSNNPGQIIKPGNVDIISISNLLKSVNYLFNPSNCFYTLNQ